MGEAAKGFSSAATLPLPRVLGRRLLLKLAARGGMGDVYLGATTGLEGAERPCIVKTVRRDHIHDASFLARFLDEARVQAQLQHPGVAQVLEAAKDESGEPYTVVEYVEGRSLSDVRQRAVQTGVRLNWPEAVAIALEIAQALAHVHERAGADGTPLGIVHRDLSPQNVMVSYSGEVKLIDFGTARGHNRRCHTVAGVVFAKPGYVAPEVARQQVGDGRIDIYALGIVLWELCAGRRFLTGDPQKHLDDAAAGAVTVPAVADSCGAPLDLDGIIAKLTHNEPDGRYERAGAAASHLGKLLSQASGTEPGERGVRARIAGVMRKLWPNEPARSRAEFARLLRSSREALSDSGTNVETPAAGPVSAAIAIRMSPEDPEMLAGTPYRLGRKLGQGEHGVVHEAEHVELGRPVAIKLLSPEHSGALDALERLRREARAVASLSHPNLVQLYDFGKSLDGRAYIAMELCHGETLDARISAGALPWRIATHVAIETAKALATAHAAGLVHRDLKPHNLMLNEAGASSLAPHVKLLDFGIAAVLSDLPPRTVSARERALQGFAVLGTPEYMAPEQVAGEPVDARTDVYSLGCVLYEMLTGTRPFDGTSCVVVMGKQLRDTPSPPRASTAARAIPRALEAVVVRAMQKRKDDRFQSANAMRSALDAILASPGRARERARSVATLAFSVAAMALGWAFAARYERAHIAANRSESVASADAATAPAPREPPAPSLFRSLPTLAMTGAVAAPIGAAADGSGPAATRDGPRTPDRTEPHSGGARSRQLLPSRAPRRSDR